MCKSFRYYPIIIVCEIVLLFFQTNLGDAFLPVLKRQKLYCSSHWRMASHKITLFSWQPGTNILSFDPSTLSSSNKTRPQLAKDIDYAEAILKAWKEDIDKRTTQQRSICSPIEYRCNSNDETPLHGCIYRRPTAVDNSSVSPGLILFHTGAGPQDMFLRWKADSLVNDEKLFPEGCIVLVADIIGDKYGWAWTNRTRYEAVRQSILIPDEKGERNELKCRVQAAINTLFEQPGVDTSRIACLGFCMGGHPILELARMKVPSVKALVTFHGVFDGVERLSNDIKSNNDDKMNTSKPNVLICTGEDDPFVGKQDIIAAKTMFSDYGYNCRVLSFQKAKHGFTNPAQDFNPSDAFAFNEDACSQSWSTTRSLLKKTFQPPNFIV